MIFYLILGIFQNIYPHAFLKKRREYCNRLRLSICLSLRPSRYLLLNRWTKFNQKWCVSCSHGKGVQRHIFFWTHLLGPWGGAKRSNIIKYQLQSQFQRFLNQTLCVFSQMKDIKHIRRDFHSLAWVMPQGSDLGVPCGVEWSKKNFFPKFNQIWCVSNLHEWHMQQHNFFGPHPLGPWGGAKRSNIIKSQSQSQFQRYFNQTLCVFSQFKDMKHIRRDFHSVPGS